ncbi:MAG: family 16 glycoside hydrolase [Isosphaeraceae bacterium]
MSSRHTFPLIAAFLAGTLLAAETKKTWDFEQDEPGKIAKGFNSEVGQWEVAVDSGNHVLYQKARNDDATFNVALAEGTSYKDLDLSVKLRAVAGEVDRGGGVVWRAKDKKNYYICRYNPLEDNLRVYKVVDGKRTMFKGDKTPGDEKWHTLRVTMTGSKIACYFDGRKYLEADDATFPDAGMIGLWSKADAQSYFDDLTVSE